MKLEREGQTPIIIGKRVAVGQIVGAACAWLFWLGDTYWWDVPVPTAMVTQATVLLIGIVQIIIVNKYGVTTQ